MTKIIRYYRHGETKWNKEGRLQGWLDSELTEKGVLQAKQVTWQPDIVFSSDLNRAVTTAQLMFPNQKIVKTTLLREIDLGDWQGKEIKELLHDIEYQSYIETPHLFNATSQESFEMVIQRMQFFHEQLLNLPYEKIAVVSHGVAIACLQIALNHDSINELWKYIISSASYITYEIN